MKLLRRFVEDPRAVDAVVVVLSTWFVLGGYVIAYAYVHDPGHVIDWARRAGFTAVTAAWSLLTLFLFAAFANGLREGRVWNRALPDGQTGTFAAALIFGAAWIIDQAFWSPVFGSTSVGLDTLFTPPHLVEMGASAVIVSGPLRAAARRGESIASPVTLASTALLLSVLTFATQFIHPVIDPWAAGDYEFRGAVASAPWLGENLGVAAVLAQALILAGTGLLLNSGFTLRPGSMTFVFAVNGVLVAITKTHFHLLPVPVVTGLAADAWIVLTSRRPGKPSASLCAVIGGAFATAYLVEVTLLPAGTTWSPSLWLGTIIATTMLSWMMGRLLRAGLPAAVIAPYEVFVKREPEPERWTLDPDSAVREQIVRAALDDLGTPEALGRSPLARLPGVSRGGSAASELREVLVDVITELSASTAPRDAECGRVLLDYYVKRVGSHEVVMERLYLTRPTYYRRLHHGYQLVANKLDELSLAPASQ
ncbi:MAG TPA: hypothetical protein VJR46_06880 [Candidatus Dormibacteraeota bacterium]|nr:hypothetical protein [Candidatus Dormibacteraeota bacterium]